MMRQENIAYDDYFRCYGIGRESVRIMRYNPAAESVARYFEIPDTPVDPALLEKMERDVLALCRALGYDMNTVEFAVRDGIPYAIDFMNPAPDADYHSVGLENYEWVIKAMADFLVKTALSPKRKKQFSANGALEG